MRGSFKNGDKVCLEDHFVVKDGEQTVRLRRTDVLFRKGDTITLGFTAPTNLDSSSDQRSYVDSLFDFQPSIGDDYSGAWRDDSTFIVTMLDVGTHAPVIGSATARVRGVILDSTRTRPRAPNISAVLNGSYGRADPPRLVLCVADDPDDLDSVFGVGDLVTLIFDSALPHAFTFALRRVPQRHSLN